MKHDCDIVRDLMPMCIDGTASDKAKQMVDEHVAECPPCHGVYAEMKGEAKLELPVQSAAPEFVTTVKRMKNRRKRRTWLTLLLSLVIAAVVVRIGCAGYYWYFVETALMDDVQLEVVASHDGMAMIHASNVPRSATLSLRMCEAEYSEAAKGKFEGHAQVMATRHDARTGSDDVYFVIGDVDQGAIFMKDGEVEVYSLRTAQSDGSGQVFYLAGEDIKEVSYKGVYIKSTERVTVTQRQSNVGYMPFATITPRPTATPRSVTYITDHSDADVTYTVENRTPEGTTVVTNAGDVEVRLISPTPMPTQANEGWQPADSTPVPTPTPEVQHGTYTPD